MEREYEGNNWYRFAKPSISPNWNREKEDPNDDNTKDSHEPGLDSIIRPIGRLVEKTVED